MALSWDSNDRYSSGKHSGGRHSWWWGQGSNWRRNLRRRLLGTIGLTGGKAAEAMADAGEGAADAAEGMLEARAGVLETGADAPNAGGDTGGYPTRSSKIEIWWSG